MGEGFCAHLKTEMGHFSDLQFKYWEEFKHFNEVKILYNILEIALLYVMTTTPNIDFLIGVGR